jgi:hypothetical protein
MEKSLILLRLMAKIRGRDSRLIVKRFFWGISGLVRAGLGKLTTACVYYLAGFLAQYDIACGALTELQVFRSSCVLGDSSGTWLN